MYYVSWLCLSVVCLSLCSFFQSHVAQAGFKQARATLILKISSFHSAHLTAQLTIALLTFLWLASRTYMLCVYVWVEIRVCSLYCVGSWWSDLTASTFAHWASSTIASLERPVEHCHSEAGPWWQTVVHCGVWGWTLVPGLLSLSRTLPEAWLCKSWPFQEVHFPYLCSARVVTLWLKPVAGINLVLLKHRNRAAQ